MRNKMETSFNEARWVRSGNNAILHLKTSMWGTFIPRLNDGDILNKKLSATLKGPQDQLESVKQKILDHLQLYELGFIIIGCIIRNAKSKLEKKWSKLSLMYPCKLERSHFWKGETTLYITRFFPAKKYLKVPLIETLYGFLPVALIRG